MDASLVLSDGTDAGRASRWREVEEEMKDFHTSLSCNDVTVCCQWELFLEWISSSGSLPGKFLKDLVRGKQLSELGL